MANELQSTLCNLIRYMCTQNPEGSLQVTMDLLESQILFRNSPRFSPRLKQEKGWSEIVVRDGVGGNRVAVIYIFEEDLMNPPPIQGTGIILTKSRDWQDVKSRVKGKFPVFSVYNSAPRVSVGKTIRDLSRYRDLLQISPEELRLRRVCSAVTQAFNGSSWVPCASKKTTPLRRSKLAAKLAARGMVLEKEDWKWGADLRMFHIQVDGQAYFFIFLTPNAVFTDVQRQHLVALASSNPVFLIADSEPHIEDVHWLSQEDWKKIGITTEYNAPKDLPTSSPFFPFEASFLQNAPLLKPELETPCPIQEMCADKGISLPIQNDGTFKFDDDVSL